MNAPGYRGRFAPSPSGPLHAGSLIAALGSWLDARAHNGQWLVRMEDIDPPREVAGAADDILRALEALGLWWDEDVLYQSTRLAAYEDALLDLQARQQAYPCCCTRKQIEQRTGGSRIYPGTCRDGMAQPCDPAALRIRTTDQPVCFDDLVCGQHCQRLESEVGDFVLKRADGLYAYQLAVVVDDAEQQITHVVRGMDLLDSTPRQIWLQQQLDLPTPTYMHLPLEYAEDGNKLSKQTGARRLDTQQPVRVLNRALQYLGQDTVDADTSEQLLQAATRQWQRSKVPC